MPKSAPVTVSGHMSWCTSWGSWIEIQIDLATMTTMAMIVNVLAVAPVSSTPPKPVHVPVTVWEL
eukprot:1388525-Amorphochlora_amoeboformis.AAC.1